MPRPTSTRTATPRLKNVEGGTCQKCHHFKQMTFVSDEIVGFEGARKVQVAEMKTQMKHAGEVREKEKKEFWMS